MTNQTIPKASGEIVIQSVNKSYGYGKDLKEVVKDCSLTIEAGKLSA